MMNYHNNAVYEQRKEHTFFVGGCGWINPAPLPAPGCTTPRNCAGTRVCHVG